MILIEMTPKPKPRMTRADSWKKRKCILDYWQFKAEFLRQLGNRVPVEDGKLIVAFYMPMPTSWSNKKQFTMDLMPHQQRPDLDNLIKAVQDCIFTEDSHIHTIEAKKVWSRVGQIFFY